MTSFLECGEGCRGDRKLLDINFYYKVVDVYSNK